MNILGVSAYYHDSAACLIVNGKIISAAQEERFTRLKHDPSFPINAINSCIQKASMSLDDVDYVVFYDKPLIKFERLIETYLAVVPYGFKSFSQAMPIWLKEKLFLKNQIYKNMYNLSNKFTKDKILFSEHHLSHAASAFYPSPFKNSMILTIDGVGEWATTTVAKGQDENIEILKQISFPHSLGLLYSAFTYYLGFKVNSGEYKVMGLAPYGTPKYKNLILENIIDVKKDGSFRLDQQYFNYISGLTMVSDKFINLFRMPVRVPSTEKLTQFHMDVAASVQVVLEEVVIKIINQLVKDYKVKNLCLAGGVALNCVANGKILKNCNISNLWIQPASGDAGGAVGAALAAWHIDLKRSRLILKNDSMKGSLLGPRFNSKSVEKSLIVLGSVHKRLKKEEIFDKTAKILSQGKVIGWFQGRMEFGPRSLGNRSILADPRSIKMQKMLNLKIKYRESFRPFAPSVLEEDYKEWFELEKESPYMLIVASLKEKWHLKDKKLSVLQGFKKLSIKRSVVPATTHVDYSSRVHTVNRQINPKFHKLLTKFKEITNIPILVNTSFNIRGEPIVCSVEDAYRCFMGTDMDYLIIEDFILEKKNQSKNHRVDYRKSLDLD